MLFQLFQAVRRVVRNLVGAVTGRRGGPAEDAGGAGVTARLPPRTPVLVGADANPLPEADTEATPLN